jgi:preprotein translocase subunit SecE
MSENSQQYEENEEQEEKQGTFDYIKQQASNAYGFIGKIIEKITWILSKPLVSETLFILFALIFATIFFWVNIQKNGDNNISLFVGYSLWVWILFFITTLVICRFLKYLRDRYL